MNKLLQIQAELKAPKSQYNSFSHYSYRSAEDILEAVKPLLKKVNALLTLNDEIMQIGERFYVKATATFDDLEGNKTTVTSWAREEECKKGMDGSQITGTASSYARKYALNGLFLIDDAKDADTDEFQEAGNVKETRKEAKPANKQENGIDFSKIWEKYRNMTREELRAEYATIEKSTDYSEKQKNVVLEIISKCAKKKEA